MNNRASATPYVAALVIFIVVVVAIVLATGTPPQATQTSGLAVKFDGVTQTWNNTVPQTLSWGQVTPSMTYTKNVTVTNLNNQTVTLILYTTEPQGNIHTWPKNNSALVANATTNADLTLTTDSTITAGTYTWLLLASNSTVQPTPTATVNPSATPTIEKYNLTIAAGTGVSTINVTNLNAAGSIVLPSSMLPYTVSFTSGDVLKLSVTPQEAYVFNAWTFSDDSFPQSTTTITLTPTANLTVTANFLLGGT